MWGNAWADDFLYEAADNSGVDDRSGGGFDLRGWVNTLTTGTAGILGALNSGQTDPNTKPAAAGPSSMLLIGGAVLAIILIVVLAVRGR